MVRFGVPTKIKNVFKRKIKCKKCGKDIPMDESITQCPFCNEKIPIQN